MERKQPVRKILHIDMDAFYSSIEQRDHPELRGRPVVVGGDPQKRGVVATCSYEARIFGIHSAMPARTALRLCPHAVFLRPRFDVYRAVSEQLLAIYRSSTTLVEPLALDEAYLDITESAGDNGSSDDGASSATQIAREIKQQILLQTQLTASAGVSFNKFLAKLASDFRKPDGLTVIPPEQAAQFLDATPIGKFFGVGKVTEARLIGMGIATGADLKQHSEEALRALFGERGSMLYHYGRGEDERPVLPSRERKSVGKETTLEVDITDREQMERIVERLADQVAQRLAALGLRGKTVTLKVTWSNFEQITRSVSLATPIQETQEMLPFLYALLEQVYDASRAVRLLGVTLSNLVSQDALRSEDSVVIPSLWDMGEEA